MRSLDQILDYANNLDVSADERSTYIRESLNANDLMEKELEEIKEAEEAESKNELETLMSLISTSTPQELANLTSILPPDDQALIDEIMKEGPTLQEKREIEAAQSEEGKEIVQDIAQQQSRAEVKFNFDIPNPGLKLPAYKLPTERVLLNEVNRHIDTQVVPIYGVLFKEYQGHTGSSEINYYILFVVLSINIMEKIIQSLQYLHQTIKGELLGIEISALEKTVILYRKIEQFLKEKERTDPDIHDPELATELDTMKKANKEYTEQEEIVSDAYTNVLYNIMKVLREETDPVRGPLVYLPIVYKLVEKEKDEALLVARQLQTELEKEKEDLEQAKIDLETLNLHPGRNVAHIKDTKKQIVEGTAKVSKLEDAYRVASKKYLPIFQVWETEAVVFDRLGKQPVSTILKQFVGHIEGVQGVFSRVLKKAKESIEGKT